VALIADLSGSQMVSAGERDHGLAAAEAVFSSNQGAMRPERGN
jgi:hypothetical protein